MATIYKVIESYARNYNHSYPINSYWTERLAEGSLTTVGYVEEKPAADIDIIEKHLYKAWEDGKLILREDTADYSNPSEFILDEEGRALYTVTRFTDEESADQYIWLTNQLWTPIVCHKETEVV